MGIIRLFLAVIVVADHLRGAALAPAGLNINGYYKLGLSAPAAVMLFYVISGFLISYALKHKYHDTAAFYRSRILRIFSLYWPLFFLMILLDFNQARSVLSWPPNFVCGALLIGSDWTVALGARPDDYWGCFPAALAPAWTLGAELTFYAIAPFLLVRWPRIALGTFAVSAVLRVTVLVTLGPVDTWTYYFFPSTICFFLLGHIAHLASERWPLPRFASWTLLAAAAVLSSPSALQQTWDNPHFYLALSCFAAALPGVFYATKNSIFLNWIGDLSFPLYLIHPTVLYLLLNPSSFTGSYVGPRLIALGTDASDPIVGGSIITAIVCVTCIVAAIIIHHMIERPFAKLLARLLSAARSVLEKSRRISRM
jgi:peptidoglycan/LPS O-acetylase OafA/YrhL